MLWHVLCCVPGHAYYVRLQNNFLMWHSFQEIHPLPLYFYQVMWAFISLDLEQYLQVIPCLVYHVESFLRGLQNRSDIFVYMYDVYSVIVQMLICYALWVSSTSMCFLISLDVCNKAASLPVFFFLWNKRNLWLKNS